MSGAVHHSEAAAGAFARRLIHARREREALLGRDLFGEPAWDMLLDLFAAHEEGRAMSVTSLCIAANVPSSTALRWIAAMEEDGKLTRRPDAQDRRRINVKLTPAAAEQMRRLLESWIEREPNGFNHALRKCWDVR